jgi:hypothetical protein
MEVQRMSKCDRLETCGFFKKYQDSHAGACETLIETFCMNLEKSEECARKKIFNETGSPPDDDLMPTGLTVDEL